MNTNIPTEQTDSQQEQKEQGKQKQDQVKQNLAKQTINQTEEVIPSTEKKTQESVKKKNLKQNKKEESVRPKVKETDKNTYKSTKKSIKVRTVSAKEIGLKIYTMKSTGGPKGLLTKGAILKGIEDGKYKWSYNHKELSEEEVMGKFIFNQIDIQDCFHILDDRLFYATESGNENEEEVTSPLPNQQCKRQRRSSK